MPITFDCACGKTLRVPDASAGKKAKCPVCGAVVAVPEPDPVFEIVEPSLPPEPVAESVAPPKPYAKPTYDEDEEDDKTPYGLAAPEKRGPELDRNGQPRKRDGLPNFNKGRKNYG